MFRQVVEKEKEGLCITIKCLEDIDTVLKLEYHVVIRPETFRVGSVLELADEGRTL